MTEQIIIDIVPDFTQLDTAIDALENLGQIDAQMANKFRATTAEINKQSQAVGNVGKNTASAKKGIDDVAKATKNLTNQFMQGFQEGVIETLEQAGVSAEEFADILSKGGGKAAEATKTVKQELRGLVEQIALAKANGSDFGPEYEAMIERAGHLKDTLADVNSEIKTTGSDTKVFDGLISAANGVTGGFAVMQGAAALAGGENEEMQKTLLKVNAAMAVLQGLQSIQNVLQKESAASLLFANRQRVIQNAQTAIDNGLTSTNIIVKGGATIAQKALNAAMAANPLGLVAVALATVIGLLVNYSSNAKQAARDTTALNAVLSRNGEALDEEIRAFEEGNLKRVAALKASGALESEIQAASLQTERDITQKKINALIDLKNQRAKILSSGIEIEKSQMEALNDRIKQLDEDVAKANIDGFVARTELERKQREESLKSFAGSIDAQLSKAKEGSARQLALRKQQISAQTALELNAAGLTEGEKEAIIAKGQQAQLELDAEFNKRKIDLQIKNIQAQLVNVKAGSDEEFKLQGELLKRQMESELTSTKLSESEKNVIFKTYLAEREKLHREYLKRTAIQTLENEISISNAELQVLNISNEDKLLLTISNLEQQAEIEVQNAEGNSAKIKEIYAKRDADIRDAKKKSIDETVEYEISLESKRDGAHRRGLERIINNERKSVAARRSAIEELTSIEVGEIDKRLAALNDQHDQGLISEKDYTLALNDLLDQRNQIYEESNDKLNDIQKASNQQIIDGLFMVADSIAQTFSTLGDLANAQAQARIEQMQIELDAAVEAGAITEKEEITRQKRIDAEQRKAKRDQAKREKDMAVFEAFLAVPKAFLQGLAAAPPPLGPILGAFMAGLATIRATAIAATPLPKFGKGKKKSNRFEGWAEVGETGAELHEQNGRMFLVKKPSITWVGRDDVIYNPKETQEKLKGSLPNFQPEILKPSSSHRDQGFDYKKMEKIYAKHKSVTTVHFEKDMIREAVADGLLTTNWRYRL